MYRERVNKITKETLEARFPPVKKPEPRVRKPAMPNAVQHKAVPGVVYHAWSRPGVAVLIVASNGASGRMLSVSENAWVRLCVETDAPSGEVALTDDDLETLLCDRWALTFRLKQATSFTEQAEEYRELKEMLFRSDPDVVAHVRKQMEVDNIIDDSQIEDRMTRGLNMAWKRAAGEFGAPGHLPERDWMVRAAHRAIEILRLRLEAAEKGSAER